jgi:hypothetical protein
MDWADGGEMVKECREGTGAAHHLAVRVDKVSGPHDPVIGPVWKKPPCFLPLKGQDAEAVGEAPPRCQSREGSA